MKEKEDNYNHLKDSGAHVCTLIYGDVSHYVVHNQTHAMENSFKKNGLENRIWKTLNVTEAIYQKQKLLCCNNVPSWSKHVLESMECLCFQKKKVKVNLVLISIKDLGFKEATFDQIVDAAIGKKLGLCFPETGILLCGENFFVSTNNLLHIAIKPITDRKGNGFIFTVGNDGGKVLLDTKKIYNDSFFFETDFFVFTKRP